MQSVVQHRRPYSQPRTDLQERTLFFEPRCGRWIIKLLDRWRGVVPIRTNIDNSPIEFPVDSKVEAPRERTDGIGADNMFCHSVKGAARLRCRGPNPKKKECVQ